MSEPIRPCPACGSSDCIVDHRGARGVEFVACINLDCGMEGPMRETDDEAIDAWNALPRWPDWRPVSEPPEVPDGANYVTLIGWQPGRGVRPMAQYHRTFGWNLASQITHWTPLPPGPGEPAP